MNTTSTTIMLMHGWFLGCGNCVQFTHREKGKKKVRNMNDDDLYPSGG